MIDSKNIFDGEVNLGFEDQTKIESLREGFRCSN